ncbi:acyl transferase domain-containing protein/acyl carrier protein [Streptomyces sp. B4I13]|uniref:type I polyketide synthase n=1 Tax=Streptomyces sp. B4I13 TaxID=3042271 RepID=UPI002783B598|nr:SDR family NAD(P)-dependent oxidoreductase [Streptomyces sp. B4I13]MDQ0957045.1 acyl transferase domain-containing protein/acyl carrier protein [Streptomyces sp. B4I13]
MNQPVPTAARNTAPGHEPVAVVGLACRLPGADDPAAYWELLAAGRSAVTDTPQDRRTGVPAQGWPTPHGGTAPLRGGYISAPADFDAAFFGISPREADAMDPQARLALELGWEALEHAGVPVTAALRAVAVYVGADGCDYADVVRDAGQGTGHHTLTGLHRSLIANRLSYALGVSGPSVTVDSAQSSSLVAVQLACDSLRLGDCDLALAGGVHLNLSPRSSLAAAQFGALSPDGACHTFDARANGYVRGEGGGIVVLKLLSRAVADRDHIHAVIRGGALNNDGAGTSITTPDADAQAAVLRTACLRAGVDPAGIGYVELHGTGTRVGDPVEAAALGAVLGTADGRRAPLAVGSVKTNIGHLEGAAGIAGLLKTVLCLSHRQLVPSLNHDEPNPAIDLDGLGLRVHRDTTDWAPAAPGDPLRAGVSSFGMGGTNVHLVLEEAPAAEKDLRPPRATPATVPWLLSAATPGALRLQTDRLTAHVRDTDADPVDIAWSLLTTRTPLAHRALAVGSDTAGLLSGITATAPSHPLDGDVNRPVFVFPGQGSQWAGMAAELLASSPVFAARLTECGQALAPHVAWDLAAVLRGDADAPPLDRSDVVQPVLWAVMVSLAALWQSYGVRPAAVVGHSQGEIAAACVAGALSLEDAALVVALRSRILVPLEGRSGMVALTLSEDAARRFTGKWGDRVTVAALNGPASTVVSADIETVDDILATAERENVRAGRVGIDYASHSPHVNPVREQMLDLLAGITPRRPDVPFLSTVTGDWLEGPVTDARYWYDNLRNPVLLEPAVRALALAGHGAFVEVSPHPVLIAPVKETVEAATGPRQAVVTGTLRRGQGGAIRFQTSLGALWSHGADVDWTPVFTGLAPRRRDLPTYAFQRRRHWVTGVSDDAVNGPMPTATAPAADASGTTTATTTAPVSDEAGSGLGSGDALRLVRECTAVVLGYPDQALVDPQRTFKELGIDSVTAVELRDRINSVGDLTLTTTAVYEYPTPARLAESLSASAPAPASTEVASHDRHAAADEPIAIVSMGCRFPGGVRAPEDLWRLVRDETDAVTEFPTDRGWDVEALYDPDPDRTGTTYVREGGFLAGAAEFDAAFFGISPREATAMDPQQRLLLETSWEAIERAGLDPRALHATATGVFVGVTAPEYGPRLHEAGEAVEGHLLTGTTASVASGRIAYALGLEGPAVTVDTACSSSLVALHLAVRALRSGECSLALAAGATVMSGPGMFVEFSRQRGLAADGRCKPFAAGADGTNWAEGVGVLLLERLSDARRLGHQVLAVVRGSAINQDGASNGLTAPNGLAQQRVIRAALADAGLSAADVDVVEAHGTGTRLGDPIEAQALLATYGQERDGDRPLWLGSLKSNIGHAQAAAGVGGVIKMVQAMRAAVLPKSLHAETPSPLVDWSSGAVELLAQARVWEETEGRPRRAAVSSFGISGTNAHVVLEGMTEPAVREPAVTEPAVTELAHSVAGAPAREVALPWLVSARTPAALAEQESRLTQFTAGSSSLDAVDVAWSLWRSRSVFECRSVGVAGEWVASGSVVGGAGSPVFVFPGQGAQWVGMAVELLDVSPVFAARFGECGVALEGLVEWSLVDVVRGVGGAPGLDRVDVVQPVLWAVMVSLAALWESFGVRPAAVVGHSQGEIAAAVVAGALSLVDGARVVVLRSRAIVALAGGGGMVSVALPAEDVGELVGRWGGRVSVAAVNGPSSTVVSGDVGALEELVEFAVGSGVRVRRVDVDYASHSVHVEALEEELAGLLGSVVALVPSVPFLSTVSGEWVEGAVLDGGYWFRNLRQTVLLEPVVRRLVGEGFGAFLEMSPHPVLTVPIGETVEAVGSDAVVVGSLRRGEGGLGRFYLSLGEAWAGGVAVDWGPVFAGLSPCRVELPTYAFQRSRYWLDLPKVRAGVDPVQEEFWRTVEEGDLEGLAGTLGVAEGLESVVPALAAWRTAHRERGVVDGWRHRVEWRPLTANAPTAVGGTWLIVAPESMEGDHLVTAVRAELEARGVRAVVVAVYVARLDRAALAALLTTAEVFAGVLSLLALDERPHPRQPAVPLGLAGTLTLLQALGDVGIDAPLWCVTRGAVAVGDDDGPAAPGQAGVWGLGRSAALEHPKRWGGLVDLPQAGANGLTALLLDAVTAGVAEDQVALRDGRTYGRRLVHAATRGKPAPREWRPRGTVLVTGGTGALGAHVARWLAIRGAEHLVLTGRRGDGSHIAGLRDELARHGTRITVAACDTADRQALADLVDGLAGSGSPVRSVVHAAGVSVLGPITETDVDDLAATLSGKVLGAAHLDEVLDTAELDAVVYFSSISGTWGVADHAAYGAANAILDARAERRRADGAPVLSVAWGPWAGGGMIAESVQNDLRRRGVPVIEPATAITGLQQALDHEDTVVAVADVDWRRFAEVFTSVRGSALLSELSPSGAETTETAPGAARGDGVSAALREMADLEPERRTAALRALIGTHVAAALGHADPEAVSVDAAFKELGFDSLTAVALRDRVHRATGLKLPTTVVFDHPSISALAACVDDLAFGGRHADARPATDTAGAAAPTAADEPIAIVSMGCRFPGGVRAPEDLWRLVADGMDVISPLPTDRGWDLDALYDPDPDRLGTSYVRESGFLDDAAEFDAAFFGISPREALAMDPQQRLLLETAWETLERAGIDPKTLRGSSTGVYVGLTDQEYAARLRAASGDNEGYLATGAAASVASGRIAYALGLEGPAVTVDTACSSSLVALHLAVRALRAGECRLAVAGAATVMSGPGAFVAFSRQRALAPDGRCKPFAADADGFALSEGVGVLLLERLSDARRLGHQVLAVVRGSAINQDGASNGLTAPNGPSQQRVIRAALADAGLSAADVDVVEAHGTGTRLGDPIEAQALLATYGQERAGDRPLWLGSVKSNIGHTQAASGMAGIIKMVQAMRHATLPESLRGDQPSPIVDWSSGAVELLAQARVWEETEGRPRRAAVSSFGISGTNAHVVLEAPPQDAADADSEPVERNPARDRAVVPLLTSARTEAALAAQVRQLTAHLESTAADAVDVAWSLWRSRSVFECRSVGVAGEWVASGSVVGGAGSPVFVFPGQGAQWVGMAVELLDVSPVFAARFGECGVALEGLVEWSLVDVVRGVGGAPGLDRVDVVQPVLWAVMVSLAALWESFGVRPAAVVGHSQGEIAAAVVAGALSLVDGARVVVLRSRAIVALAGGGGMVSVALPAEDVGELVGRWGGRVSVAAVNGPSSTVVSGDVGALEELVEFAVGSGVRVRRVDVDYASHSVHVEALEEELAGLLGSVVALVPSVPFLSTVSGEWVEGAVLDGGYWFRNLRQTVLLEPVVRRLVGEGFGAFLEMSPHPVLTVPIGETVEAVGSDAVVVGSLRRGEGGLGRFYLSLGEAWAGGVAVDWGPVFAGLSPCRVELPTYAFQRSRYWLDLPKVRAGVDPVQEEFWRTVEEGDLEGFAGTLGLEGTGGLGDLLPALSAWHRGRQGRAKLDGWRYRVAWRPYQLDEGAALEGTWLLVVPEGRTEDDVTVRARRVLEEAARVIPVVVPERADRTVVAELLDAAVKPGDAPAGVLSLLALDDAPDKRSPGVTRGVLGSMALSQALADNAIQAGLWSLTRGAVAVGGEDEPVAGQAAAWGLLRVAALDDPERSGGLVDLPVDGGTELLVRLPALFAAGDASGGESEFALRPGQRGVRVRRMVRSPLAGPAEAPVWKPRGAVLVTGGTGALGAHVARELAREGAEHLVLTSRRGPDAPGAAELERELTDLGCRVTIAACDVADRGALAEVMRGIPEETPLTAVVHTAGAVDRARPLTKIDADEAVELMHAKVVGAENLHELVGARPLDAFVLFSSGAGVWGNGGQGPYAAANAHLDALAERRRATGLPATSIAWGAWAGGGMVDAEVGEQLARRGVPAMEPALAVRALRESVAADETTVVVADIRWDRFVPAYCAHGHRPLIDEIPDVQALLAAQDAERTAGHTADASTAVGGLRGELAALPAAKRKRRLAELVRTHVGAVLGSGAADVVKPGRAFRDMGFDSLTAVELRNRLGSALGARLSATLVFDHPTPNALADHLGAELFPEDDGDTALDPRLLGIEAAYRATSDPAGRAELAEALRGLLDSWAAPNGAPTPATVDEELAGASDQDMFDLIDKELGIS